jgi:hypothetical protein
VELESVPRSRCVTTSKVLSATHADQWRQRLVDRFPSQLPSQSVLDAIERYLAAVRYWPGPGPIRSDSHTRLPTQRRLALIRVRKNVDSDDRDP